MNYVDPDWGLLLAGLVTIVSWLGALLAVAFFVAVPALLIVYAIGWVLWRIGIVKAAPDGKPKRIHVVMAALASARRYSLGLPRFCGHIILWEEGVYDVREEAKGICEGVPPADGGAGTFGSNA